MFQMAYFLRQPCLLCSLPSSDNRRISLLGQSPRGLIIPESIVAETARGIPEKSQAFLTPVWVTVSSVSAAAVRRVGEEQGARSRAEWLLILPSVLAGQHGFSSYPQCYLPLQPLSRKDPHLRPGLAICKGRTG